MRGLDQENLLRYLNVRLAIVEVRAGESDEEAWRRHIREHPEQKHVNIRIFNRISQDLQHQPQENRSF